MHTKLISSKNDEEDNMYLIHVLHIDLQEVDVWSEITIIINTCVNMIIFINTKIISIINLISEFLLSKLLTQ